MPSRRVALKICNHVVTDRKNSAKPGRVASYQDATSQINIFNIHHTGLLASALLLANHEAMAAMDIDPGSETKTLFAQVHFYIVFTDEIGVEKAQTVYRSYLARLMVHSTF